MASSSLHSFVQRRGFAVSLRTVINTAQKVFRKQDLVVHLHRRNKSQSSNSILLRFKHVNVPLLVDLVVWSLCATKEGFESTVASNVEIFMNLPEAVRSMLCEQAYLMGYVDYEHSCKLRSGSNIEDQREEDGGEIPAEITKKKRPRAYVSGMGSTAVLRALKSKKSKTPSEAEENKKAKTKSLKQLKDFTGNQYLKRLPCDSKTQNGVAMTEAYVIPKLNEIYGSAPNFLLQYLSTPTGKDLLADCVDKPVTALVNEVSQQCNQRSTDVMSELQQHYNEIGPTMLMGTGLSNAKYAKVRNMMAFEPRSQARARTQGKDYRRRDVPAILGTNKELQQQLINYVLEHHKSGCNIGRGKAVSWGKIIGEIADEHYTNDNIQHAAIHAWLSDPLNGTHVKTIYLSQLSLSKEALNFIDSEVAPFKLHKIPWQTVATKLLESNLVVNHPDLAYLVQENYLMARKLVQIVRRRRLQFSDGQPYPALPPPNDARQVIKAMLYYDQPGKPLLDDGAFFAHLAQHDFIYAGKRVEVTKSVSTGKTRIDTSERTTIRVFNLRLQLMKRVKYLVDRGMLTPDPLKVTKLYFGDWADVSPVLTWSFFSFKVGLLCVEPAFSSERHIAEVLKMEPVILGFIPETIKVVQQMRELVAPMYQQVSRPFSYDNCIYQLCPRVAKADNSMLSKVSGNSCGGHYRCCFCSACFKSPAKLFQWKYLHKCRRKTLLNATGLRAKQSAIAKRTGLKVNHVLMPEYNKQLTPSENIAAAGLQEYFFGFDALHNVHGFLSRILQLDTKRGHYDQTIFLTALLKYLSRDALSQLYGRENRFVFVFYEDILLPSISSSDRRELMRTFCRLWCEIQYILYALPSAQRLIQFRLHLHVATFKLLPLCKDLWGPVIMCLYLHNITAHAAEIYENMDFHNQSCEAGEGSFGPEKDPVQHGCRRQDEAIDDLLMRIHCTSEANADFSDRERDQAIDRKMAEKFAKHEWQDLVIDENDLGLYFLQHLQTLGYEEGAHWQKGNGKIRFNTVTEISQYIKKQ